jgi:hypothetical protein
MVAMASASSMNLAGRTPAIVAPPVATTVPQDEPQSGRGMGGVWARRPNRPHDAPGPLVASKYCLGDDIAGRRLTPAPPWSGDRAEAAARCCEPFCLRSSVNDRLLSSLSGPLSGLLPRIGLRVCRSGTGLRQGVVEMARGPARRGYLSCDQRTACRFEHRRCALPLAGMRIAPRQPVCSRVTAGYAAVRVAHADVRSPTPKSRGQRHRRSQALVKSSS